MELLGVIESYPSASVKINDRSYCSYISGEFQMETRTVLAGVVSMTLATAMIGSAVPSIAGVASSQSGMPGQSVIDNVAWQGHRGASGGPVGSARVGRGGLGRFHGGYAGRGGYGYRGSGTAAGIAGVAAGAIVGGALAGQAYPGYGYQQAYSGYGYQQAYPGYGYQQTDPGWADAGYPYALSTPAYADGGSVAYCESQFQSYNPATGTYLGFDGLRHPCP